MDNNITKEDEWSRRKNNFLTRRKIKKIYILSKSLKLLQDLFTAAWKMETASSNIQRQQKDLMEIIHETLEKEFIEQCPVSWYHYPLEVYQGNNFESVALLWP